MRITLRNIILWGIVWITVFLVLTILFSNMELVGNGECLNLESKKTIFEILQNNSYNFAIYILFFPVSIIFTFFEIFSLALNICTSVQIIGIANTIQLLLPHALIEFPNILFYTFLSFNLSLSFFKHCSFYSLINTIIVNKKYYVISYFILIISAVIEGGIG